MGAITRHWSTVLNGTEIDLAAFKKEIDAVVEHAQKNRWQDGVAASLADKTKGKAPAPDLIP